MKLVFHESFSFYDIILATKSFPLIINKKVNLLYFYR